MGSRVSFTIEATSVKTEVSGYSKHCLRAEIEGVDISDLIREIGISDLLEAIGKDAAAEHFDLVEERDLNE